MVNLNKGKTAVKTALFLAVVLIFSVIPILPAQAAPRISWYDGETETEMAVEAGSKFYIGDFVSILSDAPLSTATLSGASYRVQNGKTASVNSKGYLRAKKAGSTDVTVVCQGKTLVCHLTVEKKGTFDQSAAVKELKAAAAKLAKGMPKKLTASKAYTLWKKKEEYLASYGANSAGKLAYDGFLYQQERTTSASKTSGRSEKLAVPEAGRYLTAFALLRQYMADNNPASVTSKKTMRVSSASASSKKGKITVQTAGKLSADQIMAAKLAYPRENSLSDSKAKAVILMYIYDETAGKYYRGRAALKKGSRQLDVQPVEYQFEVYKNVDLVKGHVYLLGSEKGWSNAVKVTAK